MCSGDLTKKIWLIELWLNREDYTERRSNVRCSFNVWEIGVYSISVSRPNAKGVSPIAMTAVPVRPSVRILHCAKTVVDRLMVA